VDLRNSRHRVDDISANFPGIGPMRPTELCVPLCVEEHSEPRVGAGRWRFHCGFQSSVIYQDRKAHNEPRIENPRGSGPIPQFHP
jgi:hypothetical protein